MPKKVDPEKKKEILEKKRKEILEKLDAYKEENINLFQDEAFSRGFDYFRLYVEKHMVVGAIVKIDKIQALEGGVTRILNLSSQIVDLVGNGERNFFSSFFSMVNSKAQVLKVIESDESLRKASSMIVSSLKNGFFTSITGMQKNKGMIKKEDFNNLLIWCGAAVDTDGNLKIGDDGKYESVNDILLRSIAGMQHSKGMIKKEDFDNLLMWCGGTLGADGRYADFNYELLRSITGMQNGKGMIDEVDFNNLVEWCGILDSDGEYAGVDYALLRFITGMQNGKGMIKKEDFDATLESYFVLHSSNNDSDNFVGNDNDDDGDEYGLEFDDNLNYGDDVVNSFANNLGDVVIVSNYQTSQTLSDDFDVRSLRSIPDNRNRDDERTLAQTAIDDSGSFLSITSNSEDGTPPEKSSKREKQPNTTVNLSDGVDSLNTRSRGGRGN